MKKFPALIAGLALLVGLALTAFATETKTDKVISSTGGAVEFPGGVTMPSGQGGTLNTSTYSATVGTSTNVSAVITPATLNYVELGDKVIVSGQVTIGATAIDTASAFTLTLPKVRASNFSGTGEASGVAGNGGGAMGPCESTNSAKTITCKLKSTATGTQTSQVYAIYEKT